MTGNGMKSNRPEPERKTVKALSAAFCESVSQAGRYGEANGLLLVVSPAGSKRWIQRLQVAGKRHDIGLGSYPNVTLLQARNIAGKNKETAKNGEDPLSVKQENARKIHASRTASEAHALTVPTFAQAADRYIEAKGGEFRNEKHLKQWSSTILTFAIPVIGSLSVSEISKEDVLRVLKPIWRTKTETAKRLRQRIETILVWSTVMGHRTGENPASWRHNLEHLLPSPSRIKVVRHHPSLPIDNLPLWFAALQQREGIAARALEFAVLNCNRSGEVRGATWREVNLEKRIWTIPALRMKEKREHRIPLSEKAVKLLELLPRFTGNDLIFPSPRGLILSDMALSAVTRRMHAAELETGRLGWIDVFHERPAVPHGIARSGFRDFIADRTEFPADLAEIALSHKVTSATEAAYRRTDQVERRRELMETWANFLTAPNSPKVVQFPQSSTLRMG
jgi:integrase